MQYERSPLSPKVVARQAVNTKKRESDKCMRASEIFEKMGKKKLKETGLGSAIKWHRERERERERERDIDCMW